MVDWIDPATWGSAAKALQSGTAVAKELLKLRGRLSRKPKRKLDEELDTLRRECQQVIDLVTRHVESHRRIMEAFLKMLRAVQGTGVSQVKAHVALLKSTAEATAISQGALLAHERRLRALEERDRADRVPKVKRKRRPGRPKGRRAR